ncbi:unnamed protein product [Paramecium primaurelia]|uniref:Sperm-tail PG-rich repeat protein n=1 Tax=Paramecium primaurelia TaxID=5886 RepID=A0A8S1JM84_PARPR|nr:unnamed protein product [Paramecium primaurelia]
MSNFTQSFHGASSFGIGQRLNIFAQKQQSPSPHQYTIQSTLSTSASKFGKSLRTQFNNVTPPVGKYDLDQENNRKLKITIKGKRKQEKVSSIVGPGSYTIEPPKSNKKYGFGDRFLMTYETEVPAPNQYHLNNNCLKSSINKKNGFMLSSSKQDSIYPRSLTPAPGQYEIDLNQQSTNQTFSKAPRDPYYLDTPGPGSYHYEQKESKGFSFLAKYKQPDPSNYPGPGTYDIQDKLKGSGTIKFNSILRQTIFGQIKEESPGPGTYNQYSQMNKSKGTKFQKSPKLYDYSNKIPGPGAYDSKLSTLQTQGGVMGKLYRSKRICTTPGPGQYDIDQSFDDKLVNINRWSKSKRFQDERTDVIGPGQYDIDRSLMKTGVSFTKQKNNRDKIQKQLFESPGPGHYLIDSEIGFIPEYLIKQK